MERSAIPRDYRELAEHLGLSGTTAWRRWKQLEMAPESERAAVWQEIVAAQDAKAARVNAKRKLMAQGVKPDAARQREYRARRRGCPLQI